jgi:hypothetical protein
MPIPEFARAYAARVQLVDLNERIPHLEAMLAIASTAKPRG